jgi:release factor glutamine methyltransferase
MIKSTLKAAYLTLAQAKIENYQLDARILLEHATGLSKEMIIMSPEQNLSPAQLEIFEQLIKRRAMREPVSHLIGRREFFGRDFLVNKHVLDPRPDSETLISAIIAVVSDPQACLNILDLGTGSGCLLLTTLLEFPQSRGLGIDISAEAIAVAKINSMKLGLGKRSSFVVNCWGEDVNDQFDIIISNPPYIENLAVTKLEPEVVLYEPHLALLGGESGLDCYFQIASDIAKLLSHSGYAVIECGQGQEKEITNIFAAVNLKAVNYSADLSGTIRCITFVKNKTINEKSKQSNQ